jgi:hypothetical protein
MFSGKTRRSYPVKYKIVILRYSSFFRKIGCFQKIKFSGTSEKMIQKQ